MLVQARANAQATAPATHPATSQPVSPATLPAAPASRPAASSEPAPFERIPLSAADPTDRAILAASKYLLKQIGPDGQVADEYTADNPRHGGKTALCVYALLTAQTSPKDPALLKAIDWLSRQKLSGTYAVAMRTCAYSAMYNASRDERLVEPIKEDVKWLVAAADRSGGYSYTSCEGKPRETYDNSTSQFAVLGVWTALNTLNLEIPTAYWQKVQSHWIDQQQIDGGWGYLIPHGELKCRSYGSMTAAGLATLFICQDFLGRESVIPCKGVPEDKSIAAAQQWLGEHFNLDENPAKGVEWYMYWLFSLERVGLASGQKYLGSVDWYARGAAQLLEKQNSDGTWGRGDELTDTSLGLLFLARGNAPVLVNKLRYEGKWNPRPRDAAGFAAWMSRSFERPVRWQVLKLDGTDEDLHEAPILYISGAGPLELTPKQIDQLRQFVYKGGTIISEAACGNGDFTLDIQRLYKRLFPQYPATRLPAGHGAYSIQFRLTPDKALAGVSNGVRLLAVHCPNELSLGLELGPTDKYRSSYEQLANLVFLATDKGAMGPRGISAWPAAKKFEPAATIRVARLKYKGDYDPEPMAWQRLAVVAGNTHKIKLEVSEPMDIAALDAAKWPVAAITGTGDFALTAQEATAIKKYLAAGGTLVADAAGGSRAFTTAFEKEVLPLLPDGIPGQLTPGHAIYKGVKIAYRRQFAMFLGAEARAGRLQCVEQGDRVPVIYSPDDLTAGLAAIHYAGIRGYTPETSVDLMLGILRYAAGVKP